MKKALLIGLLAFARPGSADAGQEAAQKSQPAADKSAAAKSTDTSKMETLVAGACPEDPANCVYEQRGLCTAKLRRVGSNRYSAQTVSAPWPPGGSVFPAKTASVNLARRYSNAVWTENVTEVLTARVDEKSIPSYLGFVESEHECCIVVCAGFCQSMCNRFSINMPNKK